MELSFLGAAGEVTGSCFLLHTESVRVLIDCGLGPLGIRIGPPHQAALSFAACLGEATAA